MSLRCLSCAQTLDRGVIIKGEFTHNRKQVVNRLKIPKGLHTISIVSSVE